ncbi:MAG: CHASE domain-containing protein [Thauera sp.]|nr:CHASE domain-containing protein [Thauera sp.]
MRRFLPIALVIAVIGALLASWFTLHKRHEQNLRGHFELETQRLTTKVGERMAAYAQILRAGAGVMAASDGVSRAEWARFYEMLDLKRAHDGIQGVGFAQYIPREQLGRHVQAIRAEGFPDYAVRPGHVRDEYSSIVYLEPFSGRNLNAFGYDMLSEPVRHEAMARARDTGRLAYSGKVKLMQETEGRVQAGFLAYQPVYRGGGRPNTIALRRAALLGWVYSPYRADDLFDPILRPDLGMIRVEIFDGDEPRPETLLYDSAAHTATSAASAPQGVFTQISALDLEGRRWTLRYTALSGFVSSTRFESPWIEFTAIGVIGLLLFGVLFALRSTQRRAERIAGQLTETLRESEATLRSMLQEMPVALCQIEASGAISFRNRRFLELFGYDADVVPTVADLWQVALPDAAQREAAQAAWKRALLQSSETGQEIAALEYRVRVRSGEVRDVAISGVGFGARFLATFVDQTERLRDELRLRKARVDAEAASEAKTAFVAHMSHEIRTPMNAVLGLLQLLQHTTLSARQRDYVQKVSSAAHALLSILNDILDFSKVEAGKVVLDKVPFRLDELLRNLSGLLSTEGGSKDVEVLFQVDPEVPRVVRGDALRLRQVLLNLVGNAIKFTEHGEVVVWLRLLPSSAHAARIEFSVRDTGIGIAPQRLNAVFEAFSQAESSTTRRYGGTGLGLPICQRLVQLMGGELTVESVLGVGSTFRFVLGFVRDDEVLAAERAVRTEMASLGLPQPLRAFIADDHALVREALAAAATSFGWRATLTASAAEVVHALQQDAGRYDVICVDWTLLGEAEWAVARQILARPLGERAPVVLMVTPHGLDWLALNLSDDHDAFDAYLVKPVTPLMLFEAVAKAVGSAACASEAPASSAASAPLAGLRLLLVEDNVLNQQVARELLTSAGAQVEVADNGSEGLEAVAAAALPFDAILMDIQMPVMDGYETTRVLREERGVTVPIIAMTANALPTDRLACLAAGMNDHVGKPIDMSTLVGSLLKHCGRDGVAGTRRPLPAPLSDQPVAPHGGFEFGPALQRLGGNRTLFATLASRFESDQSDVIARIARHLQRGERGDAARELHTLKGLAAALGARALAEVAAEAENAVRDEDRAAEAVMLRLDARLAEAFAVFSTCADTFEAGTMVAAASVTTAETLARLKELEMLLRDRNMRAIERVGTLANEAGAELQHQLRPLEDAIARLDFAAAHKNAVQLIAMLES